MKKAGDGTTSQRAARHSEGLSLRAKCPRSSHSKMALSRSVRDPLSLIEDSNKGRVKNLLPIRFTRMLESPFAFFRGTAIVQAHDLKSTPATGIVVQSCGDCHLMNFSVFASPERTLIFDINDFDETLPAPFEWDLKRLASSFVLASRWRKFDKHEARNASRAVVKAYREQMGKFAGMSMLDVWYARVAVDDVLDLSRIARGKLTLQLPKADAHELLQSALEIVRSEIEQRHLTPFIALEASRHELIADAPRLQQVFWSVLHNACKFTPENGTVSVRSYNPSPRRITIEISDNGIGIEPDFVEKVFYAFEQADSQSEGLGLGLAISKAIVEMHSGTIRAHSEGLEKGATFVIELPIRARTK